MTQESSFRKLRWVLSCSLLLVSACGGDGDSEPTDVVVNQSGQFVGVEGMGFQSGATKAATGSAGEFTYEVTHKKCDSSNNCPAPTIADTTFYLMRDVALPSVTLGNDPLLLDSFEDKEEQARYATWYVSPFNVSSDETVQRNIALVLDMVDANRNAPGIQIPTAVRDGTLGGSINWASTTPRADFASLQAAIKQLDPAGSHDWPATDDESVARLGKPWQCAVVGRYTGAAIISTFDSTKKPKYIDTNGVEQSWSGNYVAQVSPTGIGGMLAFNARPWEFDGFFRFGGAVAPDASATATSKQYVDDGQFAPEVANPVDLTLAFQFAGTGREPTGSWSAGSYNAIQFGNSTRLEMSYEAEVKGKKLQQPITSLYRFLTQPIWIKRPSNFGGPDRAQYTWELNVAPDGKAWAALSRTDAIQPETAPVSASLGSNGTLSIQYDAKDSTGKDTVSPYEFKFDGVLDQASATITGTLVGYDGTTLAWDASSPLLGCSTR